MFCNKNVCLRGRESLCDIRRDCCHHFVSEWDFERDAQRVCQAERSLKSPLVGTKRCVRLATNKVINTGYCMFFVSNNVHVALLFRACLFNILRGGGTQEELHPTYLR